MNEFQSRAQTLIAAGQQLYSQGMVPATSGNFSARLANDHLAITVSGRHKGKMTEKDIMEVDANGVSLDARQPSAETWLMPCLRPIRRPPCYASGPSSNASAPEGNASWALRIFSRVRVRRSLTGMKCSGRFISFLPDRLKSC